MHIDEIDHLEFYVADAGQAARELCDGFGFRICGEGGPHTGLADCRSLLLRQRGITILVTSALAEAIQPPATSSVTGTDWPSLPCGSPTSPARSPKQ